MDPATNDSGTKEELSTNTPPEPNPPEPAAPPSPAVSSGSDAPAGPVVGGSDTAPPSAPAPKSRSLKKILIVVAIVLAVGVGSAAAYLGVILPNKPINVLKQSLANSLQEPQSSFKGTFETNAASSGGTAYKADFSGAADTAAKAADFKLDLTVTGVSFPVEARTVNQNVYIKLGDLTTVAGLAKAYSPEIGGLATSLSQQLSNKWVVIDSTLLNQMGAGCYLDASWSMTDADIQLLNKVYDKNAFVTINSTGTDTVNGQKAEKFVLSIDDDKLAAYGNDNSLDSLALVKSTKKCNKNAVNNITKSKGDHKQTPLTVWVDKGAKRIVKISSQDKQGTFAVTISYGKVSISAPANAVPAIQILTQIEQAAAANPALLNLTGGGNAAQ